MTVEAGDLFLNTFDDLGLHEWRKVRRFQHAVDDGCGEAGGFGSTFEKRPSSRPTQTEHSSLLVEGRVPGLDEGVFKFSNLERLSLFHF
jgi:hypothetical protein